MYVKGDLLENLCTPSRKDAVVADDANRLTCYGAHHMVPSTNQGAQLRKTYVCARMFVYIHMYICTCVYIYRERQRERERETERDICRPAIHSAIRFRFPNPSVFFLARSHPKISAMLQHAITLRSYSALHHPKSPSLIFHDTKFCPGPNLKAKACSSSRGWLP